MSINPYIYLGFGYIFDVNDSDFIESLVKNFPKTSQNFVSDEGAVNDITGFMEEISESVEKLKYPGLSFIPVRDENGPLKQVVVVLNSETKTLYNKYENVDTGAFYPLGRLVFADAFNGFKTDFDMFEGPRSVIWTEYL